MRGFIAKPVRNKPRRLALGSLLSLPKRCPELVEENDKPEGDMRRWMYVYLAADVYTYDLLHIAIYPYNDKPRAHAFLLELRAKGYHPRVVVIDLRVDYGPLIGRVFPKARVPLHSLLAGLS